MTCVFCDEPDVCRLTFTEYNNPDDPDGSIWNKTHVYYCAKHSALVKRAYGVMIVNLKILESKNK